MVLLLDDGGEYECERDYRNTCKLVDRQRSVAVYVSRLQVV